MGILSVGKIYFLSKCQLLCFSLLVLSCFRIEMSTHHWGKFLLVKKGKSGAIVLGHFFFCTYHAQLLHQRLGDDHTDMTCLVGVN